MLYARASSFLRSPTLRGVAAGVTVACVASARASCTADEQKKDVPVIYQYKICPFCHRVKAYLDYLNVPYETIEVDPVRKAELSWSGEYKKVPIAKVGEEVLNGSDSIIARIAQGYGGDRAKKLVTEDTDKWMAWSADRLAILLYPNITRNFGESWECFEYANHVDSWSPFTRTMVRVSGPVGMLVANGRIKKKYNIVDERKELLEAVTEWTSALKGPFLHGKDVTMPDLMVFGVMRSVESTTTFREVMAQNASLKAWYDAVSQHVVSQEVCVINK